MTFRWAHDFSTPSLDISQARVSDQGMDNFYWPIRLVESDGLRMGLYRALSEMTATAEPVGLTETLSLTYRWFVSEVLVLYEAFLLVSAFARDGVEPVVPDHYRVLKHLMRGKISRTALFQPLEAGPGKGRKGPLRLKRLIRDVGWNDWSFRLLSSKLSTDQVIAADCLPLLVRHARAEDRFVRYVPYPYWFGSMPKGELDRAAPAEGPLVEAVKEQVFRHPWPKDVLPLERVHDWIHSWLGMAERFVSFHLGALRKRRAELPAEAWFGATSSTMWSTMLAHAVRKNGGLVVSHGHGQGGAQLDHQNQMIVGNVGSHVIYAFNETQAAIIRKGLTTDPLVGVVPRVEHPLADGPSGAERTLSSKGRIRTIMYVATAYHGMRVRGRPIIPDIVALDMQARLFGKLREWGLDVIFKPHPEGASKAPAGFAEQFGFSTETRRFEDVDQDVDAYLIDFLCSSTTPRVLKSNKPVIHIDIPYPRLMPEAKEQIHRRCCSIDTRITEGNRIEVDWDGLREALFRDRHQWSMRFPDTYYFGM